MISFPKIRLTDGTTIHIGPRSDKVAKMAKDLIRFEAVSDERDSIRSLIGNGYSAVEVLMLLDDARQVAMQEIVAAEMMKP